MQRIIPTIKKKQNMLTSSSIYGGQNIEATSLYRKHFGSRMGAG
jgi:hypothetical protein